MSDFNFNAALDEGLEYGPLGLDRGFKLNIPDGRFCFVSHTPEVLRLFLECNVNSTFRDVFNGIKINSSYQGESGMIPVKGLELKCPANYENHFRILSNDLFLFDRMNGDELAIQDWCDGWKTLMGNRYSESRAYDVLAELLVYGYLLDSGVAPIWEGPIKSNHDFRCNRFDLEVKSTVIRTGALIVEASNIYQFKKSNQPLKLAVCRLEEATNGSISIDDVKQSICKFGIHSEELNEMIEWAGIITSQASSKRFNLTHPIAIYAVDDDFPSLNENDFKNDKIPKNIVNIRYSIDLESLDPCDLIDVSISDGILEYKTRE